MKWIADKLSKWGVCLVFGGCTLFGPPPPPEWILSPHGLYPPERYLTGMGEGDSREQAEKRAYAAISRIFSAQITSQAMDREIFSLQESEQVSLTRRELQLDRRIQVSTEKVLENVKILDVWRQPTILRFYVLAGIDRHQAEQSLLERLADLDEAIEALLHQGRSHSHKLERIRGYKHALSLLVDREALNADLRIIRASGESLPPAYRLAHIRQEFHDFVGREVVIMVSMEGDNHEDLERAILEGLKREGLLRATTKSAMGEVRGDEDLTIVGQGKLWPVDVPDPLFEYVRWCADIDIYEQPSSRLVGVISETGREGHITGLEARVRARSAMQDFLSREVARLLTQTILDEPRHQTGGAKRLRACPQQ
jgi:hypothetical protein